MKAAEDVIELFGMTNQIIDAELAGIEKKFDVDLGRSPKAPEEKDAVYYPQFDKAI
ncbi:MAG: hypothetical protein ICV80_23270, partial [Microcoleus sp. T1-bin1]|nr:hypothetical protein [Microcoleus sp. T1-bin1]